MNAKKMTPIEALEAILAFIGHAHPDQLRSGVERLARAGLTKPKPKTRNERKEL